MSPAGAIHQSLCGVIDSANVLSINGSSFQPESGRAAQNVARCRFRVVRVFGVQVVLTDIDHGKQVKLSQVHHFVEHALSQSAFPEEADPHLVLSQALCGERRSGGNAGTAAHNSVRSEVAGRRVGNMHGASLALAVAGLFPQQLGEHSIGGSTFRQAVSVAAMRAGDVIRRFQRLAHTNCYRFFTDVEVRQSGHQRTRIEFVDLFFKQADGQHLAVHAVPLSNLLRRARRLRGGCHLATPDMCASTSNITAKSSFSQPMPRAAVRNSFDTAVVGTGTFSLRPRSMASSMSFCIMFTSNQASSGCCNTNGPRY